MQIVKIEKYRKKILEFYTYCNDSFVYKWNDL